VAYLDNGFAGIIVGWDIGAANIKAVCLDSATQRRGGVRVASQAFEIWHNKQNLVEMLQKVWKSMDEAGDRHIAAVTMTAELSDAFLTKREGVLFILNAFRAAFPAAAAHIFSISGEFVPLSDALFRPLDFAASNWMATAGWVASQIQNCLVIDTGSTTTDILPIVDGRVATRGRTDLERLMAGELVYTGALRTNLASIAPAVPVAGDLCPVASEYFGISGDVYLLLGRLKIEDYTCPTPDGQPVSIDSARRRVARLVCADTEMLDPLQIQKIAQHLEACQVQQIRAGIQKVASRLPQIAAHPVVVLGSGSFLAEAAAKQSGLTIGVIPGSLGNRELAVAPSLAVARLLEHQLGKGAP